MGRLRANAKDSAIDRLVQGAVSSAQRSVAQAIRACRGHQAPGMSAARLRRVERDLARAAAALANVGMVASPFGSSTDPDLMTEEERSARYWAEQAERDAARQAALAAAEASVEDEDGEPVVAGVDDPADLADEGGE